FSEADMCVFKMNFFKERPGDTDLLVNKTELREVETYLKKYLKYDIPWPITAMFIKRASLKIEFDEELTRFQDVDFGIRYLLDSTRKVKISDNNKADCFYRMPVPSEKRHLDYNFINNINSSQLRLMKTIISEVEEKISDRKSQKEHLKLLDYFFRRNFRIYILPYIDHIDTSYRKLRKLLWKKGIISFKTFITYGIIERMHLWKWHEKKGTGAYTLTKKWIK
ncbi:MAG: hypothetical protein HKN48_01700, partial [Flavobacteriaceae bacterium]|nr:hypothetical protein [Flavobacteriaceae bacterium]